METESPENWKSKKPSNPKPSPPSAEEKEMIKTFLKNYYQDWLNTSLPALDDKTPLEVAKTAEGREILELILRDFEINNPQDDDLQLDPQILRKELGLTNISIE